MKFATVVLCWLLLTTAAAALVPPRHQPHNIAYTRPPDDLQRPFPTNDTSPGQRAHWLRTVQLNTLSTARPVARSAPTTTTTATTQPPAPVVIVPGGDIDPACLTGAAKTRTESDRCWRPLVDDYAWDVETALAVLHCESRGDESVVNSIGATGLFQLFNSTSSGLPYPGGLDPRENVRMAYEVKYAVGAVGFYEDWRASAECWSDEASNG